VSLHNSAEMEKAGKTPAHSSVLQTQTSSEAPA
jgi:hypothetical protein